MHMWKHLRVIVEQNLDKLRCISAEVLVAQILPFGHIQNDWSTHGGHAIRGLRAEWGGHVQKPLEWHQGRKH